MKNEGIEHGTFWRISIEVQVISGGSSLVTTGNRFENTYNFLSILLNSRNWNGTGMDLAWKMGK
jgi:hypothetical protein